MSGIRILIVEDQVGVMVDLEACLQVLGYAVAGRAATGEEALRLARALQPNLVLVDLRLEGGTGGIATARGLRERFRLPVVFVTDGLEDRILEEANAAEPYGYLCRPFAHLEVKTVLELARSRHLADREVRRLNRLYATLSQVNQAIARSPSRQVLFERICQVAVQFGGFQLAWVGWLDPETRAVKPVACAGDAAGYLEGLELYADDRPTGQGITGQALLTGQPYVANDYLADVRLQPWHALAEAKGFRAAGAFPIHFEGQPVAAMMFYSGEPEFFQAAEISLLQETARDVTFAMDKLAEEARRREAEAAADQARQEWEQIFQAIGHATLILDARNRILAANRAAVAATGRPLGQLLGQRCYEVFHGPDCTEPPPDCPFVQARTSRHLETCAMEVEALGGTFLVSCTPVFSPDGQLEKVIHIATDITARKQMEAQLLRSQRMETLGALAGGIAHDLNNILTPILMSVPLIQETCQDEESQLLLRTIQASAQRGADIIRQLLTFGRGLGERVPLNPNQLIGEVLKIINETFPKSIVIRAELRPSPWQVFGDATQLHQVLMNLCVNARDAMPEGGTLVLGLDHFQQEEQARTASPERQRGWYVVLTVTDTGAGIPAEIQDKVFEPFFTTKALGKGTGLGLATVQNIVKNHGGRVELASQVGQGARFAVFLPAVTGVTEAAAAPTAPSAQAGRGELILVVDDEPPILRIGRRALESAGYQVLTANNGAEALGVYAQQADRIQLVVMDVMMPAMGGPAAIRALRAMNPHVRILVVSGMITPEQEAELTGVSVQGRLSKPFRPENLLAAVRRVLDAASSPGPGAAQAP